MFNRILVFSLLALALASAPTLLLANEDPAATGRITAEQAHQKMANGALVLDVRTPEEFAAGHLDKALNISHDQILSRINELGTDKNKEIVIYCKSGRRAGIALQALEEEGFKHIYNAGGYADLVR